MLTKLKRLIHRSTQIQAGCLAALQNIARRDETLSQKEKEINDQLNSLKTLETLNELVNEVVTREKIFAVLRKIAVIRQRRTQLEFERNEIEKERRLLAEERKTQLAIRKQWWLKEQKYVRLRGMVLRERMQKQLFQEEMELEDRHNETYQYDDD